MTSDPDLYALVLRLRPARGHPPPQPQGHGAHALFLDLIRQVDADLAQRLHADAQSKPFTVAILPRERLGHAGGVELRATLTQTELFAPITQALLRQLSATSLRLGSVAMELVDVLGTPEAHPWAGYGSFAELHARAEPAELIALRFATPTAFAQGQRLDGRARLELFPRADTVFGSLARRWNDLAPPALALDRAAVLAAADDALISRYQLETMQISLGSGPQKGFIGLCEYAAPTRLDHARLLALLADAAFFLGVGMKTARGMGLVRRVVR